MDEKQIKSVAEAAQGVGDSGLGIGVGKALVALAFFLPVMVALISSKWDGHFYDRKGCVQIQEAGGRVFKVDTCTGDTKELTE